MMNTEGFFTHIFKNARENSVIIMNEKGVIQEVNQSFIDAFGYKLAELKGKHLRKLFNASDKKIKKPEIEVETAMKSGSKSDNNYLVHKDGSQLWVMGESVRVENIKGEKFLVKIIHNIHAQKELERFLISSNDFINTIFDSVKTSALLLLDSELRISRFNAAFIKMFNISPRPEEGSKLSMLGNSFWRNQELRSSLINMIVTRKTLKNVHFTFKDKNGLEKRVCINAKFIDEEGEVRRILLVINLL